MRTLGFAAAIEEALAQAMADDPSVIVLGEDVHLLRRNLLARFGGARVLNAPISESGFLGASVTAAMSGLRPVVEVMLIDFVGVCADALLNHAAKVEGFTGGRWSVPMVVRAACGGGYGDGGQHEQTLWGWLAHIPGLSVVAPATPADAGGLLLGAIRHDGPVVYLEHKLLADYWRDYLGEGDRDNVSYDVPAAGTEGEVPDTWEPIPLGSASVWREGRDLTMVSCGVGSHRCLEAAESLEQEGVAAGVIDLRSISPLDWETVKREVTTSGKLLVVDEDYQRFGLSGELAAGLLEAGVAPRFGRVCTAETIPYARHLEDEVLPNVDRILRSARALAQAG